MPCWRPRTHDPKDPSCRAPSSPSSPPPPCSSRAAARGLPHHRSGAGGAARERCNGPLDEITVTGDHGTPPRSSSTRRSRSSAARAAVLDRGRRARRAEEGDTVIFDFVFVNGRTGERVRQSSYEAGDTATSCSTTHLLRGVRTGLLGAKGGSRVVVAISPDDGYGLQGGDPAERSRGRRHPRLRGRRRPRSAVRSAGPRARPSPRCPACPLWSSADNGEPTITVPAGDPPAELVTQLLIEGSGPVVASGPDDHRPLQGRALGDRSGVRHVVGRARPRTSRSAPVA